MARPRVPDVERALNSGGYVFRWFSVIRESKLEHVYVWEQDNGFLVPDGFEIHHRNGVRNDNRIENLELVLKKKHRSETCTANMPWLKSPIYAANKKGFVFGVDNQP